MAAKWQQWMPFHIDRFKASSAVRAMHPTARAGYLYLLTCQWQSDDCSISSDPLNLAEMSELEDELWAQHGPRILRNFEVMANGRLRNGVCHREWTEAKRIFEANYCSPEHLHQVRSAAGRKGNDLRWGHIAKDSKCDVSPSQTSRKTSPTGTYTETSTSTSTGTKTEEQKQVQVQKQKRSAKAKPVAEPTEHTLFRQDFDRFFQHKNQAPAPWDAKEATVLSRWMKANPTISRAQWQTILNNRARSPCAYAAPLSKWIGSALAFLNGTADDWGKPTEGGHHGPPALNRAAQRTNGNIAAAIAAAEAITDHGTPGHPGRSPTSGREPTDAGTPLLGTRSSRG